MASRKKTGPKEAKGAKRPPDPSGHISAVVPKSGVTRTLEEERYRLALESINHGHYDWEILQNTIYYSETLRAIFGMQDDQLLTPEESTKRLHPDDHAHYRKALQIGRAHV